MGRIDLPDVRRDEDEQEAPLTDAQVAAGNELALTLISDHPALD